MEEIGLFPLGLVAAPDRAGAAPHLRAALRELITECLEADRPFGLVYADDDGLRRTGTLASVVEGHRAVRRRAD